MRRTASVLTLIVVLAGSWWLAAGSWANDCYYNPSGRLICDIGGTLPGNPGDPPGDRPPLRYLYTSTDPVVGDCYYFSRTPGGLDIWDPANDPAVIGFTTSLPVCPVANDPPATVAWRIFRSFPLALPTPSLEPPGSGITGLPTYLATPDPLDVTHTEVLPDGRTLDVRASVAVLVVDWGDGARATFESSEARAYPSGSVIHMYTTKTCDATYRREHPSGGNCHPTLDAYPITATFTWAGRYRVGGAWIDLGTLNRTTTVPYDVDEVQGVLQP
jgi:hypothetical protein